MSLTKEQLDGIRQIRILAYSDREHQGKALCEENGQEKEFKIPHPEEILKAMVKEINNASGTKIERCSPTEADCIIRVYWVLHHKYDWGLCFNIYGANCYTKTNETWETSNGIHTSMIDHNRHQVRLDLLPDEILTASAEFIDYYVKLS